MSLLTLASFKFTCKEKPIVLKDEKGNSNVFLLYFYQTSQVTFFLPRSTVFPKLSIYKNKTFVYCKFMIVDADT